MRTQRRTEPIRTTLAIAVAASIVSAALLACAGTQPPNVDASRSGLAPCPSSPNCVSSDAADPDHHVDPFRLAVPEPVGWQAAREAVLRLPRTRIVGETGDSLHAECRSALFGFVDDLELQLRRDAAVIAVRSASRTGWYDLGVNRRRVGELRGQLHAEGAIR